MHQNDARQLAVDFLGLHTGMAEHAQELQGAVDRAIALYGTNTRKLMMRVLTELIHAREFDGDTRILLTELFCDELKAKETIPSSEQMISILSDALPGLQSIDPSLLAIILYGSWARSEQRADSDLDIIYIRNRIDARVARNNIRQEIERLTGFPVDTAGGSFSLTDEGKDDLTEELFDEGGLVRGAFKVIASDPDVERRINALKPERRP